MLTILQNFRKSGIKKLNLVLFFKLKIFILFSAYPNENYQNYLNK